MAGERRNTGGEQQFRQRRAIEQGENTAMTLSNRKFFLALSLSVFSVVSVQLALAQTGLGPAPVPKTGQIKCWDATGMLIACQGTGQDGDVQAGVPYPNPRFTDNKDGTVTDNFSGLTWVRQADCFGRATWLDAMAQAAALASGQCGLTDK